MVYTRLYFCVLNAEEGCVEELQQLLSSGVVKSLKVVDSDGHHVLNIAIQHKQDKVVQVRAVLCAKLWDTLRDS